MGRTLWACLLVIGSLARPAAAQLGEAHLGALVSFASGGPYGWGGGLTASYAPGRLGYVGFRWIYYAGSTELQPGATETWEVTDRAQLFGADLALQMPVGPVEVVAGMTLGVMRFSQSAEPAGPSLAEPVEEVGTGFVFAPLLMAEFRTGPLMVIPQVSYYFSGAPDFTSAVQHQGLAWSLMVVVPFETHRIAY